MTCLILFSSGNSSEPKDAVGCLLPHDHEGPHEFVAEDGRTFLWETDWECTCEHCMSADGDYCSIYWPKEPT